MSIHEPVAPPAGALTLPPDAEDPEELDGLDEEVFVVPASFVQQRLWLIDQVSPGQASYNVPLALRLRGPLDADALAEALGDLADRHEVLRTALGQEEGEAIQLIFLVLAPPIRRIDLTGLPEESREAAMLYEAEAQAGLPFDLSRAPLFRAHLFRLAPEDHLLLVVFHHAITDNWSHGIFFGELFAFYQARLDGTEPDLPELQIQYGDFAAWQRQWLQGETLELKLLPWRRRLAGAPDTLALPTDRSRGREDDARGGLVGVSVPAPVVAALRELGRASNTTTFMLLLAGFQALLARSSGQKDLVVGSPVANRNRLETEGLIGFFTNTLVLRADLRDDPTFRDHLARVREVTVEAFAYEDLPFEKLVEELRPERRLNQNPLFQVMFSFHHPTLPGEGPPRLSVEPVTVFSGAAKVDLLLNLAETDSGVEGFWEYSAALFDRSTVARISEQWLTLLADAAAHPERRVSELAVLPESERHQITAEWSWTLPSTRRASLAHQLFEEQADLTPNAPAAVFEDKSLTYRELEERSNRLAHHLRRLGVRPDALVGLCVERSLDLPVAVLGVLKAGAAYLPLDPDYPAERLAFMAGDAQISALVTQAPLTSRVPAPAGVPVVRLDADRAALESESGARPESGADLSSLVYLIYTSGSTGRPKGIGLPHRALVNLIEWRLASLDLPPGSVTLQFSSLSFDASFQEMFSAWASAGSIVLVSEEVRRDPVELLRAIDAHGVHSLYLPFIAFQALARAAEPPHPLPRALREVLSTGEQLQVTPQVRSFFARLPECRLDNHYGPSETHVVTALRLGPDPSAWPAVPGIGRAIDGCWIYIVDPSFQPLPVGVPGELVAGGVCLARGYHGRPGLTAEKFVPNPFAVEDGEGDDRGPGSRLYRTGDLARFLPNGSIELLGRMDGQMKIRGVRLEPGEIETALAAHPAVSECAVVARPLGTGELALVAYVTPRPGTAPTVRQLREVLAAKLPDAAVPSFFVTVPALPRTPSGKVDRKALPAPGPELTGEGFVAPRTPLEEVLAGIWSDILRIDAGRVGAFDSFFDLGGHSLTAMSVTSQVRSLFQVELPTRALFEAPVLSDLAERIDRLIHARQGLEVPSLVPAARGAEAPLSFAQQRLWFLDALYDGASPFYNLTFPRLLSGPLDGVALGRALSEIVRRHEALRTTFRLDAEGRPVQVIHPAGKQPLPIIDLQGLPESMLDSESRRVLESEVSQPFDLAAGPILRTWLVRLAPEHHVLGLTLHHIVADGWSLGILDRELATLYAAFATGEASPLPELPIQYADFALWQQRWLEGPTLERQLAYWRQQLQGAPRSLDLVTDRPRPAVQTFEGATVFQSLPDDLARGLEELARRHRATPFMALLAGFATLLHRHTGQEDLVVGSPIANRGQAEVEKLIGFFVNMLPLRADLSGEPTFEQLLGRVRETALAAYAHQDLPFEALVEALQPERSLSLNPLFQVILNLQDVHETHADTELTGLASSRPFHFERSSAVYDLSLLIRRARSADGTHLAAVLSFKRDLFERPTAERLLDQLRLLLAGAVAAPRTPAAALPLWSEAAWHQMTREWNDSRVDYAWDVTADRLIARVAERQPDALAVTGPDGRLTYGELEERASRLAGRLRLLGVGPEERVGILLERSVEMVVACLAAMKAGGAYMPLDTTAPERRLGWLVEDARCPVVITREAWAEKVLGSSAAVVLLEEGTKDAKDSRDRKDKDAKDAGHGLPNLAYVIYTSGSTGEPKGVEVEHRSLLHTVCWYQRRNDLGPGDRVGFTSSPLFDLSVSEVWGTLASGATLCVPPADVVPEPGELLGWLAAEQVGFCCVPTILVKPLLEHPRPEGLALKTFSTGGDRCPIPPPGLEFEFVDYYGPSEATVATSWVRLTSESRPSIGRPVDNDQVFLLDRHLRPVPMGGVGEICIGGLGVSRGYGRRPALTAERYIPHPLSEEPGERLYRSGDLGRHRPDGTLEFLGRTDHQVKVRGFRIELGEIEAVLGRHPGVREAVVVVRETTPGDSGLAAYYVPADEAPEGADLRAFLQTSLPDYMVPAVYVRLEELPRTATGKPDRNALPAPDRAGGETEHVPPRTPTEQTVAALWQELLGLERVGAEDHFFNLGGHSLLAVRLVARLRDRFQVPLSTQIVFEAPTVARLAAALDRAVASGEAVEETPALVSRPRHVRQPRSTRG